jgi:hypothetical protein
MPPEQTNGDIGNENAYKKDTNGHSFMVSVEHADQAKKHGRQYSQSINPDFHHAKPHLLNSDLLDVAFVLQLSILGGALGFALGVAISIK